jgi:predicted AlkP superfamily phosphohydrolase/phosphomutase
MWATILTGRTPGSHGIFDYWQRGPDGAFFETRGRDVRGPRLWDEFAKNGTACGFVNVPMTYPPPQVSGFALSGQDAPGDHHSIAYPRAMYTELSHRFGRYHHKDIFPGGQDKSGYGRVLVDEVSRQAKIFEWFARRDDWRFLMLYSSGTAFAQHYFWDEMREENIYLERDNVNVVEQTFMATDELVGSVIKALKPSDSIFIISECGAGPIAGGIRLNSWLQKEGFLTHRRRDGSPSFHAKALAEARVAARRHLPKGLFHFANSFRFKGWLQEKVSGDGIDWSRTVAYHGGKGEGNIYLNVIGRDLHGSLPKSDYENVRNEIAKRLFSLIDPNTGAKAVKAVWRREDIFKGECLECAPDLIIEWDGFRYMPSEDLAPVTDVFGTRTREYMTWTTSGSHRPEGLLIASGPNIVSRELDSPIELIDLSPTWLALLEHPVPQGMEGKANRQVLESFLTVGPRSGSV